MFEFLIGFLFGTNNGKYAEMNYESYMERPKEKNKYIPKYCSYYRNERTWNDEDWKWIEPKFRKRYINIYREEAQTIIKASWTKDKSADETCKCSDQEELEIMADSYKTTEGFDNNVVFENEGNPVCLNVELEGDITISIDKFKRDNCRESISCFDLEEAREVLIDMKCHYCNY